MIDKNLDKIEDKIYIIRGQRVLLDSDLAELYGVDTKQLNRQVKRNIDRFPPDFAFELLREEYDSLRCQFGTSKSGRGGRRYLPMAFTELGVGMLSSVLNSKKAIEVNIFIVRIFLKLRSYLLFEQGVESRLTQLEKGTQKIFKIVFERLDSVEEKVDKKIPSLDSGRKKIGIKRE